MERFGFETLHPLVSIAHFDKPRKLEEATYHYGLYALFLKENKGCKLSYARTEYDFDESSKATSFAVHAPCKGKSMKHPYYAFTLQGVLFPIPIQYIYMRNTFTAPSRHLPHDYLHR